MKEGLWQEIKPWAANRSVIRNTEEKCGLRRYGWLEGVGNVDPIQSGG